jgi:hypothetical protein
MKKLKILLKKKKMKKLGSHGAGLPASHWQTINNKTGTIYGDIFYKDDVGEGWPVGRPHGFLL